MSTDFTVVFEKLDKLQHPLTAEGEVMKSFVVSSANLREMDEISELCRLVSEITDPEPSSYTMS